MLSQKRRNNAETDAETWRQFGHTSAFTLADFHREGEHTSAVAFRDPEQQFLRYAQDFGRRLPLRSRLVNASN